MADIIQIKLDDRLMRVLKSDYVKSKTKQLREFGYNNLTEVEVANQLNLLISGKAVNVIGMFMQGEVIGYDHAQ